MPTAVLDRCDLRHTTHDWRENEHRDAKKHIYNELSLKLLFRLKITHYRFPVTSH